MPPVGRRKSVSQTPPAGQADDALDDADRDALVDNCLAAHAIIADHGTPTMRRLIDLLLFEIGSAIGELGEGRRGNRDLN